MPLAMAVLLPHPIDRDVSSVAATDAAAKDVAAELARRNVATVVVLQSAPFSPTDAYTPPAADPAAINVLGLDKTSSTGFVFDNDVAFVDELATRARPAGWAVKRLPQIEFDAATLAALSTIGLAQQSEQMPKLVVASLPYRTPAELVDLGLIIGGVAKQSASPVALVAVANLSSRLTGENTKPEAATFDNEFKAAVNNGDLAALTRYDLAALEAAGEEASRPTAVLLGATQAAEPPLTAKLRAYEAPSTTGYAVVTWS
jgi:hypothetical protein